jgi:hypothetical protein
MLLSTFDSIIGLLFAIVKGSCFLNINFSTHTTWLHLQDIHCTFWYEKFNLFMFFSVETLFRSFNRLLIFTMVKNWLEQRLFFYQIGSLCKNSMKLDCISFLYAQLKKYLTAMKGLLFLSFSSTNYNLL